MRNTLSIFFLFLFVSSPLFGLKLVTLKSDEVNNNNEISFATQEATNGGSTGGFNFRAGRSTSTGAGPGGSILFVAGNSLNGNAGGAITLVGGTATSTNPGGAISFTGGGSNIAAPGAAVSITAGSNSNASGTGGTATIAGGAGGTGGGGDVIIKGGTGSSSGIVRLRWGGTNEGVQVDSVGNVLVTSFTNAQNSAGATAGFLFLPTINGHPTGNPGVGIAPLAFDSTNQKLYVRSSVTSLWYPLTLPFEFSDGNSGTSKTIDWDRGSNHKLTLTGNVTLTLSNPVTGSEYLMNIATGAGGFTVTWPGSVLWPSGVAPVITATASKTDIIKLYYDGTNYFGSFYQNY